MVRVGARQAILAECERWSSAIHRTGYIPHDMLEPCRPALVFVQNARQGSPLARGIRQKSERNDAVASLNVLSMMNSDIEV